MKQSNYLAIEILREGRFRPKMLVTLSPVLGGLISCYFSKTRRYLCEVCRCMFGIDGAMLVRAHR